MEVPMRWLLVSLLLGCDPVGQAAEQCNAVLDERLPAILDELEAECRAQCEAQLGEVEDLLADVAEELVAECVSAVEDAVTDELTQVGCVDTPNGWDCTGSTVCE